MDKAATKMKKVSFEVNGNRYTVYQSIEGGEQYRDLTKFLRSQFRENQGDFYQRVLGVSRDDAFMAGWNPNAPWDSFSLREQGWRQFVLDAGKIHKTVNEETVDVIDEVLAVFGQQLAEEKEKELEEEEE